MICLSFSMPHWFHNLCFWSPFKCPWNFLRINEAPGSASDRSSGELTAKQPTVLGASEASLDKENRRLKIPNTGIFVGNWGDSSGRDPEIPIKSPTGGPGIFWCFVFFAFGVFFLRIISDHFFEADASFGWGFSPALISIGGKSLYSLLASTLPIKLRRLGHGSATDRPQFPKEHVGLVLVYQRSWGVL